MDNNVVYIYEYLSLLIDKLTFWFILAHFRTTSRLLSKKPYRND